MAGIHAYLPMYLPTHTRPRMLSARGKIVRGRGRPTDRGRCAVLPMTAYAPLYAFTSLLRRQYISRRGGINHATGSQFYGKTLAETLPREQNHLSLSCSPLLQHECLIAYEKRGTNYRRCSIISSFLRSVPAIFPETFCRETGIDTRSPSKTFRKAA